MDKFVPFVESKEVVTRPCDCGSPHSVQVASGIFHYMAGQKVPYAALFAEHRNARHVWLALFTGRWPGVEASNCCVLLDLSVKDGNIQMSIASAAKNPFRATEVYEGAVVSRDEVLAQPGAKKWVVEAYQLLMLQADKEIFRFLAGGSKT